MQGVKACSVHVVDHDVDGFYLLCCLLGACGFAQRKDYEAIQAVSVAARISPRIRAVLKSMAQQNLNRLYTRLLCSLPSRVIQFATEAMDSHVLKRYRKAVQLWT